MSTKFILEILKLELPCIGVCSTVNITCNQVIFKDIDKIMITSVFSIV